jgi:hypothetical protein
MAGLSSSRSLADFDLRFVIVSIRFFFAFFVPTPATLRVAMRAGLLRLFRIAHLPGTRIGGPSIQRLIFQLLSS